MALAALLAAAVPVRGGEDRPSAFDVFDRLSDTYAGLPSYQDRGTLEVISASPSPGVWEFETLVYQGAFRFLLSRNGVADRGVWVDGAGSTYIFDAEAGTATTSASLGNELFRLLPERADALAVPFLLLEYGELLLAPEAAHLDGPVECKSDSADGDDCWLLELTRLAGTVETRLWVDRESHLVHRLEVRRLSAEEILRRAMEPAASGSEAAEVLRVSFDLSEVGEVPLPERLAFRPPEQESHPAAPYAGQIPEALATFSDEISVGLVETTVRVLDRRDVPIEGLTADDFRVRVARREVPVRSVDWVPAGASPLSDLPLEELERYGIVVPPPGRLMVLFVQASLEPSRVTGQMQMLREARRFLATLTPDDYLAVVSFDSSLKLRMDFTRDRSGVEEAFNRAMRVGKQAPWRAGRYPSLARYLDYGEARDAAVTEEGLAVLGQALRRFPGEKVMLYLGYGLGDYIAGVGLKLGRDYGEAVAALKASETTVFVVDVTQADGHSLEGGIQNVAASTGGEYLRLYTAGPQQVVNRLGRSLGGYYLLTFEAPRKDKRQKLQIELVEKKGRVLTRDYYVEPAG